MRESGGGLGGASYTDHNGDVQTTWVDANSVEWVFSLSVDLDLKLIHQE